MKKYYKQLYIDKLSKLDEIDIFLERQKLPKLTKQKIDNMNSSVSIK